MGNLRTYGTLIGPVKGHSVRDTDIDEQVCMAAVTTIGAFQMKVENSAFSLAKPINQLTFSPKRPLPSTILSPSSSSSAVLEKFTDEMMEGTGWRGSSGPSRACLARYRILGNDQIV